ncbi:MAG: class I SAM-dependent methyltransferase [Desulfobacterales bacterium]|nr:class I SAM-dependent methyltransferase [Desulfobacterales bacterium]
MPDQEKYWDKVAGEKAFTTPFQLELFAKHVSINALIFDFGCGYGRTLNELHNFGYKNLVGADFSENMIKRGKSLYPHLDIRKIENNPLPFDDNHFDAIILLAVITCIIDNDAQEVLIEDIHRILKSNGIVYINDFLINKDKRNIDRYKKFETKYNNYGTFELPEGVTFRHHAEERIKFITGYFKTISYEPVIYETMNGNRSKGFYYIGKKL